MCLKITPIQYSQYSVGPHTHQRARLYLYIYIYLFIYFSLLLSVWQQHTSILFCVYKGWSHPVFLFVCYFDSQVGNRYNYV